MTQKTFRFQPSRRRLLSLAGTALFATTLSGCGFRLRGRFEAPFESLYIDMPENSLFTAHLKRAIEAGSSVKCVNTLQEADAVLRIVSNSRSSDILTVNDVGKTREYELTLRIAFNCTSPVDGFEFIETTPLSTSRVLPYTESEFLSREKESEVLYRDMENDLIVQIVRRLAAAHKPKDSQ